MPREGQGNGGCFVARGGLESAIAARTLRGRTPWASLRLMRYDVVTPKTAAQAAADLQTVAKQHGFGTLHVYNLKEILTSKGFPQTQECFVLEVCNPAQANQVLTHDFGMNVALPCRISVYEDGGRTKIGMIRPKAMLAMLSPAPALKAIADEVETTMVRIIDETK